MRSVALQQPDPPEHLRVLLVEDDEDDYLITRGLLRAQDRTAFELDWASNYADARSAIAERRHDVYLLDYRLGARTGLELVAEAFGGEPLAPVVLLTGQDDWHIDVEASRLGVIDYLAKTGLGAATLERSLRYAVRHHAVLQDLRMSEERYSLAARAANDGIWDWDLDNDDVYLSPRWRSILGQPEDERHVPSRTWFELVHPDDLAPLRAAIDAHLDGHTPYFESEHRMHHASEGWRWVLTRGLVTRDAKGRAIRMAGSLSDIDDRKRVEQQLLHDAFHDALSGLPNRALFIDRLAQALRRAEREPQLRCAVLFVDVDRFKLVNDSLSHSAGDQLLVAMARRLAPLLRPGDTVARLGGDEFAVLVEDITSSGLAMAVAERIQDAMRTPFRLTDRELFVTVSIGVAINTPTISPEDLVRNADIAMYDAKRDGRSCSRVFDDSMHADVATRMSQETELRRAVAESRMRVFFQPIVDLGTGRIGGFEALARWPADLPSVGPDVFIAIAEEVGLIDQLGMHVLRDACETLARWRAEGVVDKHVSVSVNVSGRQLANHELARQVAELLEETELPAHLLQLEITESTLMESPEMTRLAIDRLIALGIGVMLDDFGTGYSSLTLLHLFPGEVLKIDRSFVGSMDQRASSDVIVRSITSLAHGLGMRVIAEGIENQELVKRLRSLGCEYGQGYLFSRPAPPDDIERLLASWSGNGELLVHGAR